MGGCCPCRYQFPQSEPDSPGAGCPSVRGRFCLSAQGHMSVPTLVALGSPSLTKVLGYKAFLRHQPVGARLQADWPTPVGPRAVPPLFCPQICSHHSWLRPSTFLLNEFFLKKQQWTLGVQDYKTCLHIRASRPPHPCTGAIFTLWVGKLRP